ncbi:MAG: hypothetical protein A2V85_00230 [Chloroflexi bacterium RBG_16_72_14]|nr:MAG: hypothetical protein A2V85_00230 [Chloroflexi bacterium RBG_16_72_14]
MYAAFQELGRAELTLYTDSLIARGSIRTRQHRVTDILNLAEDPFLILEEVTVEEFGGHGTPIRAAYAQINLDTVLFAVANTPVEPIPELRTPKTQEQVIIEVPPFKIIGTVHLLPTGGNLREALVELTGRFLPVTDATYWSDQVGEARQTALALAINHHRAQILAPHKEIDPWAGLGGPAADAAGGGTPPPGSPPEPPGGGW